MDGLIADNVILGVGSLILVGGVWGGTVGAGLDHLARRWGVRRVPVPLIVGLVAVVLFLTWDTFSSWWWLPLAAFLAASLLLGVVVVPIGWAGDVSRWWRERNGRSGAEPPTDP